MTDNLKLKKILIACAVIAALLLAGWTILAAMNAKKAQDTHKSAQQADKQQSSADTPSLAPAKEEETPSVEPSKPVETAPAAESTELEQVTFEAVDDSIFINKSKVEIYDEPAADAEVIRTAERGTMFKRTGAGKEWTRIKEDETEYYVATEHISQEPIALNQEDTGNIQDNSEPIAAGTKGKVVVIDPGHQAVGDSAQEPIGPGATATKARVSSGTTGCVSGWAEYELNLVVSLKLREELVKRGYTVHMTRETHDVRISNKERAEFAAAKGGDILVRIHANGSDNSSVSGALCMAPSNGNPFLPQNLIAESQKLSQSVIDQYVAATGFPNQGVYATDDMSGINWSTMPVTIVEMGYMSNPGDDANMKDGQMQEKIVQGIVNGIDGYFG